MIAARALKASIATPTLSTERARVTALASSSRRSISCAAAASDYGELKLAAVRSQLAYQDPDVVDKLWQSARNPLKALVPFKPEDINDTQAARFREELADLDRSPTFITTPPTDKCEDAQAYAWTRGDTLFVTFRGTHGFKDIIADIEVRDTEIPSTRALNAIVSKVHDSSTELFGDVRVHEGFYEQLLSVKPQIEALLDGRDDIKTIHFSGHSLGGGIAQIAAAMFADKYSSKRVTCQTFGGPRCGNKDFVKWFEKVVADNVRVTNKNDPVPMVPQRPVWLHTAPCICIDDEVIAKAENADVPWFMRWLTTAQNIDLKGLTDDHSIELYITRLELLEELPVASKAASSDAAPIGMSGSTPQTA